MKNILNLYSNINKLFQLIRFYCYLKVVLTRLYAMIKKRLALNFDIKILNLKQNWKNILNLLR